MKNKTKKILFSILGAVILVVGSLGVVIGVDCANGGLNGTIVTNVQPGYGQDEWRQYDVDIDYDSSCPTKFYTNEPGDYIYCMHFRKFTDTYARISYGCYFNIADDFETFFVLRSTLPGREVRSYITPVETTHWIYCDTIDINYEDLDPQYNETYNDDYIMSYHIVEIWIRTID